MNELSEKEVLRRRGYKEKAKNKFQPKPGRFPDVSYPLDVIQIDHTPMDIILADDKTRQAIGRPWLTVAIDVYSRMICVITCLWMLRLKFRLLCVLPIVCCRKRNGCQPRW